LVRPSSGLRPYRRQLAVHGFTSLTDATLGVSVPFRAELEARYFTELEPDLPSVHVDRDRARDVLGYAYRPGGLVEIWRSDQLRGGDRDHRRVDLTAYEQTCRWAAAVISLVPERRRMAEGTFTIHLFRTRTVVTETVHRDDARYVAVYVVNRVGSGAETRLTADQEGHDTVFATTLEPGQLLMFRDDVFWHATTALTGDVDQARREAFVCTINHADHQTR
jgi:hypothetical protein